MAAETFKATDTSARAPESAPEPLFSRPEMRELMSDSSVFKAAGTASNTSDFSSGNGTLDFNTNQFFQTHSKFMMEGLGSDAQTGESEAGGGAQGGELSPRTRKADLEDLKSRLSTGTTHARMGEDLSAVAQRKLGENASPEQRDAFKKAVEGINGLKPGENLARGRELKLPGVNENGDFVHTENGIQRLWSPADGRTETRTPDGTKTTNFTDGATRIEQANGDVLEVRGDKTTLSKPDGTWIESGPDGEITSTKDHIRIERDKDGRLKRVDAPPMTESYMKADDGQGGSVELGRGMKPEENFALVQRKDGQTEVFDKGPDGKERVSRFMDNPTVEAERKGVMERAEKRFSDPAELARFKADMVRFEQRASDRKLEPTKVADTYKAIGQMLDGGPDAKISQDDRNLLAQQVMSHAANPTSVDQGFHDTCALASLESNIYTKDPDRAARLISEVSLTGQFKTSDGKTIKVPDGSLKPDHEAEVRKPSDGDRDFASQIFQVTAVNSLWQTQSWLPGWTYEQDRVKASDRQADKGERTRLFGFDYQKDFDGLNGSDRDKINQMITGSPETTSMPDSGDAQEMGRQLEQLQRDGKLPRIMTVHTGNPPFGTGSGGGWHAVNVIGYDPVTRQVMIDNQWGSNRDLIRNAVPLDQIFRAQRAP